MSAAFVYMTAGDKDEARRVGQVLIEERLAACVNILDGMTSMFWWDGEVQDDSEVVVIAKTREESVQRLVERVKAVHSYDCPCIVAWPLADGNPDFLKWIETETAEQA